MRNSEAFHAPLKMLDSEDQTVGCRHSNPDICAKNRAPKICAFVRNDDICKCPPRSWGKQFKKLKSEAK